MRRGEGKCKNEFAGVATRGGVEPRYGEPFESEVEPE